MQTAREDADYRKWSQEEPEDERDGYPGAGPAAGRSEDDGIGNSDGYGGEETPPQAPTPSGPSFTPSGSGPSYRQVREDMSKNTPKLHREKRILIFVRPEQLSCHGLGSGPLDLARYALARRAERAAERAIAFAVCVTSDRFDASVWLSQALICSLLDVRRPCPSSAG
jgi:hypothetical protein